MNNFHDSSPLFGANETYIAELYQKYRKNPSNVPPDWVDFFAEIDDPNLMIPQHEGPSWAPRKTHVIGEKTNGKSLSDSLQEASKSSDPLTALFERFQASSPRGVDRHTAESEASMSIRALMLIRAFRVIGHSIANLDPLQLIKNDTPPELTPEHYGFKEDEYDTPIFINNTLGLEHATINQIVAICHDTYCGSIGVEYVHVLNPLEKSWIQERIESIRNKTLFSDVVKRSILEQVTRADRFETFLDKKFRGAKRFGLEGLEVIIPAIETIFKRGSQLGIEEIVIGMAHRGRLNVLANLMEKPYRTIFAEFSGLVSSPDDVESSGDVKYHLGTSADREYEGKNLHLSLNPNPSHLEAVNTVVLGRVRAKQNQRQDINREKVMGLLLHGDAAFIGQGIVAETFLLSQVSGYRTGGTIHIAQNNQIGFTTNSAEGRSSPYCTDMAKTIGAPVFHVNGDDPEACVHVAQIVTEYRQKFKKDIVLDIWGYRRRGHNEGDEPKFTQPLMYKTIEQKMVTREIYGHKLEKEKIIEQGETKHIADAFDARLDAEFEAAKNLNSNKADWLKGQWEGLGRADEGKRAGETGVDIDLLREVGKSLCTVPKNFNIHSRIARQLTAKQKAFDTGEGIDWGTAEALAFGTLLCESTTIRLSGEDSQRGTFSHRHAVLHDQKDESKYVPLNNIRMGQAPIHIIDSPLSEFGLLGFEYGFAVAEPHALVIWEAQFGDFANGAQVIIDQFIASGETKWLRMCGLVLLLPHGYEGQGPEHSSARLERYLQLCAEDNMQICSCTTPANFFHVLRRQMRRNFRKPLIIMSPKSLLRHKHCVSSLDEFVTNSVFHRLLWDHADIEKRLVADEKIKRVVMCTGKIYFDLMEERDQRKIDDIYLLRVEQLYPFPDDALATELGRFSNAEVVWCQEEPGNMGSWYFIDRRLEQVLLDIKHKPNQRPRGISRSEAASTATGSAKRHAVEQADVINQALTLT